MARSGPIDELIEADDSSFFDPEALDTISPLFFLPSQPDSSTKALHSSATFPHQPAHVSQSPSSVATQLPQPFAQPPSGECVFGASHKSSLPTLFPKHDPSMPAGRCSGSEQSSPSFSPSQEAQGGNPKEKQRNRQRVRRSKISSTLDMLKTIMPDPEKPFEAAAASLDRKRKMDQTQVLEMAVNYIQQLKEELSNVKEENLKLRVQMEDFRDVVTLAGRQVTAVLHPPFGCASPFGYAQPFAYASPPQPPAQPPAAGPAPSSAPFPTAAAAPPTAAPMAQRLSVARGLRTGSGGVAGSASPPTTSSESLSPASSPHSSPVSMPSPPLELDSFHFDQFCAFYDVGAEGTSYFDAPLAFDVPTAAHCPPQPPTVQPPAVQPPAPQPPAPQPPAVQPPAVQPSAPVIGSDLSGGSGSERDDEPADSALKRNIECISDSERAYVTGVQKRYKVATGFRVLLVVCMFLFMCQLPLGGVEADARALAASGRVLAGFEGEDSESATVGSRWLLLWTVLLILAEVFVVVLLLVSTIFIDNISIPYGNLLTARKANELGRRLLEAGLVADSQQHFERALFVLGYAPRSRLVAVCMLPLETCRQVLHRLRVGVWLDRLLFDRLSESATTEIACAQHALFVVALLRARVGVEAAVHLFSALNHAECSGRSLLLAQIYATFAVAFRPLDVCRFVPDYYIGRARAIAELETGRSNPQAKAVVGWIELCAAFESANRASLSGLHEQIGRCCAAFDGCDEHSAGVWRCEAHYLLAATEFLRGDHRAAAGSLQRLQALGGSLTLDGRLRCSAAVLSVCCQLMATDGTAESVERVRQRIEALLSPRATQQPASRMLTFVLRAAMAKCVRAFGDQRRSEAVDWADRALRMFAEERKIKVGWFYFALVWLFDVFLDAWHEDANKSGHQAVSLLARARRACELLAEQSSRIDLAQPPLQQCLGRLSAANKQPQKAAEHFVLSAELARAVGMGRVRQPAAQLGSTQSGQRLEHGVSMAS